MRPGRLPESDAEEQKARQKLRDPPEPEPQEEPGVVVVPPPTRRATAPVTTVPRRWG